MNDSDKARKEILDNIKSVETNEVLDNMVNIM